MMSAKQNVFFMLVVCSFASMATILYLMEPRKDGNSRSIYGVVIDDSLNDSSSADRRVTSELDLPAPETTWLSGKTMGILKNGVVNIEKDVVNMNVPDVIKLIHTQSIIKSRLVEKLYRSHIFPRERCKIRIGIYCSSRCKRLFEKNDKTIKRRRFSCPLVKGCTIERRFERAEDFDFMATTDVLIIIPSLHDALHLEELMATRPPGQLWILYSHESPQHDPEYAPEIGNPYNLSMSYSTQADIFAPFCHYTHKPGGDEFVPISEKKRLMMWMASNCNRLSWRRGEFVSELEKHLSVDTYGKCSKTGFVNGSEANQALLEHKFYLSLENSECQEYISEKVWTNSLQHGSVPIVYGSSREDYERTLPPGSFIYLEDFTKMSDFVAFIRALDDDDARYMEYFAWRKDAHIECQHPTQFIKSNPQITLCYLLRKLLHVHAHPETSWQHRVPDFGEWWRGQCTNSTAEKELLGFNVH